MASTRFSRSTTTQKTATLQGEPEAATPAEARRPVENNHVQALREAQLLSKAELARRAGISTLTIDRVERGEGCRLDTKRKIILALGLKVEDKDRVFGSSREGSNEPVE